jgi:hypothetical protein
VPFWFESTSVLVEKTLLPFLFCALKTAYVPTPATPTAARATNAARILVSRSTVLFLSFGSPAAVAPSARKVRGFASPGFPGFAVS